MQYDLYQLMEDGSFKKISIRELFSVGIATLAQAGIVKPDGTTVTVKPDGTISVSVGAVYELGEIYYFRNPTLRPGFQPCQGGLIQNAATLYPQIWAYLQTTEGQQLCKTEAQWQALTQATWGDGSFKASWNGIGGAPYFVQDLNAGTLRMPDIRGMFACAAGDGTYAPSMGGSAGDRGRNATGTVKGARFWYGGIPTDHRDIFTTGVFDFEPWTHTNAGAGGGRNGYMGFNINLSRGMPTGATFAPRSWGALASVYLGHPATT